MNTEPGSASCISAREARIYLAIFLAFAVIYAFFGLVPAALGGGWNTIRPALFGFSQLGSMGLSNIIIGSSILLFVLVINRVLTPAARERVRERMVGRFGSAWFRVAASLLLVAVFFALRNNFVNYDGRMFAEKFARDIPLRGAHVTHDEMWELYLHSRFWFHTNRLFGWSAELSYQVLSSAAGGVFVLVLMYYCSLVFRRRPLLAFVLCVSGGYMQLFFGDVENYTLTTTWMMAYFLASALYLRGRLSLVIPSILLAVALTFHLLAGFLLPSLLVLFAVARRRGERRPIAAATGVFCAIVGLTLLFFHLHGLPIGDLWYHSNAFGHGGHIRNQIVDPSTGYYFDILNLTFLLAPAWILLVPLFLFGRIRFDDLNLHLIAAALFMGLFVLGWKATLGVYSDWNMFAAAALPFSLLVARGMLSTECTGRLSWLPYLFAWLFMLHSFSWVISNHFLASIPGS